MAWKLISLSLWKIRCKWEDYHHYGVISHEMVASLLVLFMRCASLFQPANVLLWPSEGQRIRRLPQKELGISRQDFLQAWKGEATAQRKVSAARFVGRAPLGLFPGTNLEASRTALPPCNHQHPACPLNFSKPFSWPYFRLILLVSLVIKLIFLLNLCEFLPLHGRTRPK